MAMLRSLHHLLRDPLGFSRLDLAGLHVDDMPALSRERRLEGVCR